MASAHPVLRVALVLLVTSNALAIGAVAQTHPRHVPFDGEPTEMATVHTNGRTYVVYAYDNLLPYADGIEVYTGGERVTSAATVDEVFQALARRRATKFAPESRTIERLRQVIDRSQAVQTAATDAITALNETLAYRATLKDTAVNDTTAWATALDASEALEETFASGFTGPADATELRNRLLAVRASAARVEASASRVVSLLQRRQAGREINRSDLYRRYAALYADLETLRSRVAEVHPSLAKTAEASRTVASEAGSVPEVGEAIRRRFSALGTALDRAERRLAEAAPALAATRAALPPVATDEAFQARLTERWKQRQGAVMKVYATLAEGGILLGALVIALFETRRASSLR